MLISIETYRTYDFSSGGREPISPSGSAHLHVTEFVSSYYTFKERMTCAQTSRMLRLFCVVRMQQNQFSGDAFDIIIVDSSRPLVFIKDLRCSQTLPL